MNMRSLINIAICNDRVRFYKSINNKPSDEALIKSEKKFGLKNEHTIICSHCGNAITTSDSVISVKNNHRHTFINPGGLTYQIVCYSSADGCVVYGEPTLEHTWFEGFNWSFCTCSNCLAHLGWFYQNKDNSFFGLILDRIKDTISIP